MSKNQKRAPAGVHTTKIILTGGGSGGHITPLLPLARALKAKDPNCSVIYIGLKGDKIEALQAGYGAFDKVGFVSSGKFRRYHGGGLIAHLVDIKTLALNFRDIFKIFFGTLNAIRLLRKYKPDIVFSKGGYVVVPVGIAARLRGVPIITHDSDAVAGLANRLVGRWARLHATGMPPRYYGYKRDSVKHVGIPLDERFRPVNRTLQRKFKQEIDLPPDSLVLLVAGGGLGSSQINQLAIEVAPALLKAHPKLHIVHFSGSGHQDSVAQRYMGSLGASAPERVKVLGFASDFFIYSGAADLVLARAGATTIAELAIQAKAAVIIPAAFLAGGHQLKNAEELTTHDAAEILDNDVKSQKLFTTIDSLLQNDRRRAQLAHNIGSLAKPDSATALADIILQEAKN